MVIEIDCHRTGGTGNPDRSNIMTTITRIEAIEDNGGGLHLAVFEGDSCTHFFSGFEFGGARAPSMQDEIAGAVADGVYGWDGDAEDAKAAYDSITSHPYGWKMIAEWDGGGLSVYEDDMGTAGRIWARVERDD